MPRFNLNSLQKRTLSALILIPVAFWALYTGGWPLFILVAVCFLLVAYEWIMLVPKMPGMKGKVGFSVVGLVYVPLAFFCFLTLSELPYKFHLVLIIMIWASDIAAYFTGKIIGGPKLIPALSPNKTWSGLCGAVIGPVIILNIIYPYFFPPVDCAALAECEGILPNPNTRLYLSGMAVLVGFFGQVGDLFISFFKRKAKVKDTGMLLPGHGGILDRLDSLLLVSIVFTLVHMGV